MATIEALNQIHTEVSGTTATNQSVTVSTSGATVFCLVSSASSSDNHGTPTFNSVSMTRIQSTITGVNRTDDLFYISNIAAGTYTLHVAPSSIGNRYSFGWAVVDGLATTSALDASAIGTYTGTAVSSVTGTVTVGVSNAFVVMINFNQYDASTNSTKIFATGDDCQLFYFDGAGAGSFSMTQDRHIHGGTDETNWIMASFKPNAPAGGGEQQHLC